MGIDPRWVSIFADTPIPAVSATSTFWTAVTATVAGEPVGDHREFLPLQPSEGDRYLWLQRIGTGVSAWHPDLYVVNLPAATAIAVDLGAQIQRVTPEVTSFVSPGGLPFCLVVCDHSERSVPLPATWPPGAHRSRLDQLCLDIPSERYDGEVGFWTEMTGWALRDAQMSEFGFLERPPHIAVRFLLQRLGADDVGTVRAHADFAADDRSAETVRHRDLGAVPVRVTDGWTTLRAPGGHPYCITDRRP